ncbi:MAG TPA: fasciclin domain-containing protein [Bacteroides sp.]|nr:fasciclin domain-containing protein [Bacteroides sp.]
MRMTISDAYRRSRIIVILLALTLPGIHPACSLNDAWEGYYRDVPGRVDDHVLDLIGENENYSRFYDGLMEYGFDDLLSKNQYFTVFVPVNSAFEGLPEFTGEEWAKIFGFHILYTKLFSHEFADLNLLTTIGKYLNLRKTGEDEFSIFESRIQMNSVDHFCQNGVIHEIDRLLLPKPNLYEYIMSLDPSYSILQDFLSSMDERFIDYEKSVRIGVDDNGNAVYDTVWREENYFLDQVAGLDDEAKAYTGLLPSNDDVMGALEDLSGYFGDIGELDEQTYGQLLFITFSGSFLNQKLTAAEIPDTIASVTGKTVEKSMLQFSDTDLEVSNGMVHLLDGMTIPKGYFVVPITIECDVKANRTVSNTMYPIEQRSDTRATNGSFVYYGCNFVGDYIEFTVDMVLKTTYWFIWTGPKQGPSHYQLFVKDEISGEFVPVGGPVNNWTKGNFVPVVSGTHTFNEFGTKTVRMTVVDELPLIGYNSIFLDYIKMVPDEIYSE